MQEPPNSPSDTNCSTGKHRTMSSVFITNVDDYVAPSQACVNPLFSEGASGETKEERKETHQLQEDGEREIGVVVTTTMNRTRRGRRRRRTNAAMPVAVPSRKAEKAQVTMADCLACSGCVTTAETVLVEQHSLSKLKELLQFKTESMINNNDDDDDGDDNSKAVAFTISPAVWADLHRHLLSEKEEETMSLDVFQKKVATFLHQACKTLVVLDGSFPLQWSQLEAAKEFCDAYRRKQNQEPSSSGNVSTQLPPAPSIAISSSQQQVLQDGAPPRTVTYEGRAESRLPLLSSSCPALVCLVEKSHAQVVPHLATTKSPMAIAGAWLKEAFNNRLVHVCVMPCHDKKLEASRRDFVSADGIPDVDLVITSKELLDFMEERIGTDKVEAISKHLDSLPEAMTVDRLESRLHDSVSLVQQTSDGRMFPSETPLFPQDFFAFGSGGYADFIFRFAAKELFGTSLGTVPLPWKPVETMQRRSARVASRKKEYHSVTLYRQVDGTFSCSDERGSSPVLRFATAYGLQTLQRVLQPLETNKDQDNFVYDYVEAMACPSGCANGGGQVRLRVRESPSETRERVSKTQQIMASSVGFVEEETTDLMKRVRLPSRLELHTRYHVVAPLQLTMGATAGVAVQDTQW